MTNTKYSFVYYFYLNLLQIKIYMKNVTLQIPENKYSFIMELLKSFDYVKVEEEDIIISEEHKGIVRQRVNASQNDPSRLLIWDDVKHKIKI